MVFREVSVIEIREVLRSWLAGAWAAHDRRAGGSGPQDRAPVRRGGGGRRAGPRRRPGQLTDELSARSPRRPGRPARGHGQPWEALEACREEIQAQVKQGLTVVKIGVLLERQGVAVPYRTLHRFCGERCG